MTPPTDISRGRLIFGGGILVFGFLTPLLIPLVTATGWSVGIKTTISGLLAFGVPEVFMLIAVAVLGKQGYEFLKAKALNVLKSVAPSDEVSLSRYRVGLAMFSLPLLIGAVLPYLGHFFNSFNRVPMWGYFITDAMFLSSFFVLGGNFWDKFSGLFNHRVKVIKRE